MKTIIPVIIVLLFAFGGWYYMSTNQTPAEITNGMPTPGVEGIQEKEVVSSGDETPDQTSDAMEASVKEFTVTGSNFKFAPETLTVKKGDTVKITFVNGGGFHDFVIDEFNVATPQINDGQAVVEFVASKAGTFEYYCSVGTHRQMGMKGTLSVTE